jgi:two-component system sensor histidine kinase PilS (NtrC family)
LISTADSIHSQSPALTWRVLGVLNLYRVLVPMVLIAVYYLGGSRTIGVESASAFFTAAAVYLVFGFICILVVKRRVGSPFLQSILQVGLDVLLLMLILHACGGVASGFGLLLLVPVGAVALLVPLRLALFMAAVTALVMLTHTIWLQLNGRTDIASYTTAGLLGAVLLIVAGTASVLALRMRESEALVRQKEVDLANLAELSQYIVQHLRESLLVVDAADQLRLINESAAQILGADRAVPGALLGEVSPLLLYSLTTWRQAEPGGGAATTFVAADGARIIQPHFAQLGHKAPAPTLIFLEDTSLMAERVQQSKLAALGRLSASIAHEIRNPVGAMSHAGQLLAESPHIGPDERRLTDIIRTNSERVSTIINNVLQLSRREATRLERLNLEEWLEDFVEEFAQTMQVPLERLAVRIAAQNLEVRIDPSHLHQVVWNLCDNALKHAPSSSAVAVEISVGRLVPSSRPYLEVSDRGPGIESQYVERIFEPFFTGGKGGTGLGLFISRELCQLNGSVLLYAPRSGGGSTFRVVFSDPQRWKE